MEDGLFWWFHFYNFNYDIFGSSVCKFLVLGFDHLFSNVWSMTFDLFPADTQAAACGAYGSMIPHSDWKLCQTVLHYFPTVFGSEPVEPFRSAKSIGFEFTETKRSSVW